LIEPQLWPRWPADPMRDHRSAGSVGVRPALPLSETLVDSRLAAVDTGKEDSVITPEDHDRLQRPRLFEQRDELAIRGPAPTRKVEARDVLDIGFCDLSANDV
jgi:hypothetical protein